MEDGDASELARLYDLDLELTLALAVVDSLVRLLRLLDDRDNNVLCGELGGDGNEGAGDASANRSAEPPEDAEAASSSSLS